MRVKGPGKRVMFEEPVVEVEIFPDGSQRDGLGREVTSHPRAKSPSQLAQREVEQ